MSPPPALPGVEVFGEEELVERLRSGSPRFRACISIGNPRLLFGPAAPGERMHPLVRASFDHILRLSFFDLERPFPASGLDRNRLPGIADARRVVRFFERTRGRTDGWTIHCWAGVSRSTAAALALLYLLRGDEDLAAEELVRIRPEALPNLLFVRCFDAVLGSRLHETASRIRADYSVRWIKELEALRDSGLEELEGPGEE